MTTVEHGVIVPCLRRLVCAIGHTVRDRNSAFLFWKHLFYSLHEAKTGTDGTLAWVAGVRNRSTEDDFVLMLKELQMPDGSRRPYSMWLTGGHPRALDWANCSASTYA